MELNDTLEQIKSGNFLVEIFGLGYVGFPLAIRLGTQGISVRGVDVSKKRVSRLLEERLFDSELYLKNEFLKCRKNGKLEISEVPIKEKTAKIGIICVPTPIPTENTKSDIFVLKAVESFVKTAKEGDLIFLESSIEVGTTEKVADYIKSQNLDIGRNFGLSFCPERIDPANKEWGVENIPRVIYCSDNTSYEISKLIYQHINGSNLIRVTSPKIAEIVKSFENAFRLVNISLVNELAMLCDKLKIDVKEVIDAASTKPFGFLPHYPGAGAGGHCIPKDPRFLLESAKKNNISFSIIENALKTNSYMPIYIANAIEKNIELLKIKKSVIVCGLSYKANVEDMRDSASFKIISELRKKNFQVFGYDPFFKHEFLEKYLKENHLEKLDFEILHDMNDSTLKDASCICIVQHHDQIASRLNEIYKKSIVPLIYDCQQKLEKNDNSSTILDYFGD